MKYLSLILNFIFFLSIMVFPARSEEKPGHSHFKNQASVGDSLTANSQKEKEEKLLAAMSSSSAESFIPQTTEIEPSQQKVEYLWPDDSSTKNTTYRLITPPSGDSSWPEPQPVEPTTWSQVSNGANSALEYTGGMVSGGLNKLFWAPYNLVHGLWHADLPSIGNTALDMISGTPHGQQLWQNTAHEISNAPASIKAGFKAHVELAKRSPFLAGKQHGEVIETALELVALPPALKALSAEKNTFNGIRLLDDAANDATHLPPPKSLVKARSTSVYRSTPLREPLDKVVLRELDKLEEEMAQSLKQDMDEILKREDFAPQVTSDATKHARVRWPNKIMEKDPTPPQTNATYSGRLPRCGEDGNIVTNSINTTYEQVTNISATLKVNPPITRVIYDHPDGLGRITGFVVGNERGVYNSIEDALDRKNIIAERGNIIRGWNLEYPLEVGDQVAYTNSDGTLAYQHIAERINGSQLKLENGKILSLDYVVGVVAQQ